MTTKEMKAKKFELLNLINFLWKDPRLSKEQKEEALKDLEKVTLQLQKSKEQT